MMDNKNKDKHKDKHKLILEDNEIYNKLLTDETLSFPELCSIIKTVRVKEITSMFLRGIFGKKHQQFQVELFLSLFLMYRFHNIVFEGEGSGMDNRLLELVREILQIMRTDILKNRNLIMHKLLEFKEKFEIWKNMDLKQQVKLYSETYYELELLKLKMSTNQEASAIYRDSIVPLQNKIKKVICYLAGDKGLTFLENYKTQHLKLTVLLEKKLRENLRNAFWDKLAEELFEVPSVYSQIPYLFKDIRKLYMSIIGCINDKDTRRKCQNDFNAILDIEYMEILINTGSLNEEVILNICIHVLEQIKVIGIPKNDSKITKMISKINKELDKELDNNDSSGFEICSVFKLIMKLLEELQIFCMNNMINDK
jgi:hypothetical protein